MEKGGQDSNKRRHYHAGVFSIFKMDAGLLSRIASMSATAYFVVNYKGTLMENDLTLQITVIKCTCLCAQRPLSEVLGMLEGPQGASRCRVPRGCCTAVGMGKVLMRTDSC